MLQRNVLLIDIPSYSVPLISPYRELLERRLKAQTVIIKQRLGFTINRPGLPYSRGLLLVAAYLEQRGHNIRYLVYPDRNDARDFTSFCKESDIIGFTAMTPVVHQVYALCKQARRINPAAKLVLGGPHANVMASRCLDECPELDIVVVGEGEMTFAEIVEHLDNYQDTPGICYRQSPHNNKRNAERRHEQLLPAASMPGPAYHLLRRPVSAYAHNIRTFSGCPYKCDFCFERLSWRGKGGRNSLHRVIDELRFVTQGAAPNTLIHFSDSIFTLDKERVLELCYLLAREQLGAVFSCDTRVDHLDQDIVRALSKAGFVTIRLGVEDLDDTVLRNVHKGIFVDQSMQALEIIRSTAPQMVIHAYMLTGLPGSTIDTFTKAAQNILKLIIQEKVDIIGNKILVPYPGTPFFDHPERHHVKILHQNWSNFDRLSFPAYRTASQSEYEIYFGFLNLESILMQAYETRIVNPEYIDQAVPESLDYVYRSYVKQAYSNTEVDRMVLERNVLPF